MTMKISRNRFGTPGEQRGGPSSGVLSRVECVGRLGPLRPLAVATLALLVSGCMVGPDYHRPQVNVAATYSELPGWTQAEPASDKPKGDWWTAFNDPLIDQARTAGVGVEPDRARGLRELSGSAGRSAGGACRPVSDRRRNRFGHQSA